VVSFWQDTSPSAVWPCSGYARYSSHVCFLLFAFYLLCALVTVTCTASPTFPFHTVWSPMGWVYFDVQPQTSVQGPASHRIRGQCCLLWVVRLHFPICMALHATRSSPVTSGNVTHGDWEKGKSFLSPQHSCPPWLRGGKATSSPSAASREESAFLIGQHVSTSFSLPQNIFPDYENSIFTIQIQVV
jgi:hypothetical protein